MECTFPPVLFLHHYLRRSFWDGVKDDVWRGRVKGKLAKYLQGWPLNVIVSVCVCYSENDDDDNDCINPIVKSVLDQLAHAVLNWVVICCATTGSTSVEPSWADQFASDKKQWLGKRTQRRGTSYNYVNCVAYFLGRTSMEIFLAKWLLSGQSGKVQEGTVTFYK